MQYSEYGWEAGIARDIPLLMVDHWAEFKLILRELFSLTYSSSLILFLEFQTTTTTRIYDLLPALRIVPLFSLLSSSMRPAPLDHYHCFVQQPIPLKRNSALQLSYACSI